MNNKYININQLLQKIGNEELNERYVRYICGLDDSAKYHKREISDINLLLKHIELNDLQSKNFLYGYVVPQLSKEFDLLKVSSDKCVDIELKSEPVPISKIKKQLVQNRHYLNIISSNIFLFTYVSSNNTLYTLTNGEVEEVSFDILKATLEFEGEQIDLDNVFTPSNILVSPLNNPDKFIEGKYLLTDHQQVIKDRILDYIKDVGDERFFGLTGSAGTGKTLLIYDIAKELSSTKKVLMVHSGIKCRGHYHISRCLPNLKIIEAKELRFREIKDVDLIIIDEAHRLYESLYDKVVRWTKRAKSICVFSLDSSQKMSISENKRNTDENIKTICGENIAELTGKIRTNKNISLFIRCLLDLSKYQKNYEFKDVNVLFEPNEKKASDLAQKIKNELGYTYISYTPSSYSRELDYQNHGVNTHEVIGQEYDEVVMILNHHFYYDGNILNATNHPNPDYLFVKLLSQGLTRARSKICLIVTTEDLLNRVLSLFNR